MPENRDRKIIPTKGGVFSDLATRIKLVIRLIGDPRVSPFLKILPIGSVLYFLIPDLAPGPIDDVAVIWLGSYLFVELCPPEVVQEHMQALNQIVPGEWKNPEQPEGDVIEGEFWEKKE